MKKLNLKFLALLFVMACALFSACSTDDGPAPTDNTNTGGPTPGSVEGTVTIDGTTSTVSGNSTNSSFGFIMSTRKMNPPNSYPALNVSFGAKPTKDSIYNLASTSNSVSIYTSSDSQNDGYIATSGSVSVDVDGSKIIATFSNLSITNYYTKKTITASGSVTCY